MSQKEAVAYIRVSGAGQLQGDGFDRQRDAIARYAKSAGYRLVDEFRDEGVSGTKELANRPGLAKLLDRIEHNGVKVVVVERADRLARDLMVSEVIIDQLTRAGARVLTAEGVDLTKHAGNDPTRDLIRQILGAVAEFDKRVMVLKLRAARDRIRAAGNRCEGQKPYGTRDGEATIVDRMRQLRRKPVKSARASFADIAATLNAEGFTNRAGRPWSARMVWHVVNAQHG